MRYKIKQLVCLCRLWLGLLLAQAQALLAYVARQAISELLAPLWRPCPEGAQVSASLFACMLLLASCIACSMPFEGFQCPSYIAVVLMSQSNAAVPCPYRSPSAQQVPSKSGIQLPARARALPARLPPRLNWKRRWSTAWPAARSMTAAPRSPPMTPSSFWVGA